MPFFFPDDVRILDHAREREISAVKELLELKSADAVDEKSEHGIVFPGLDLAAESFHIAFLIGTAECVGNIHPDITGQTRHFSEMIHFFRRGARDNELIQLGRCGR